MTVANPTPTRPPALALGLDAGLQSALARARIEPVRHGRLHQALGTVLRASGVEAQIGELCELVDVGSGRRFLAEVTGFDGELVSLNPLGSLEGLSRSVQVVPTGRRHSVPVGDFALGRVVDGMGTRFLDAGPPPPANAPRRAVDCEAPAALARRPIDEALPSGVAAIDALLTLGVGQRVGVFSPAGCGKSTLMAMLCRHAEVDVTVVALVGERGREVAEFIQDALDESTRGRCTLVVATSDASAVERFKAAFVAMTHAEHHAAQGRRVLLVVDSITRMARAAREIGLAAGELPARRGFPPSVYTALPRLFERAGRFASGSITALFTVLEETEDGADPISEEVRSLLDGHIVLSRKLAGRGHFPAIDVLQSASRLFDRVVPDRQPEAARALRELLSKYEEVEILLRIGEYRPGADALADRAVGRRGAIDAFLRQPRHARVPFEDTVRALARLALEGLGP